jgi:hypothetical protein
MYRARTTGPLYSYINKRLEENRKIKQKIQEMGKEIPF